MSRDVYKCSKRGGKPSMGKELRIAGSGGQGVILASIILTQAIGIYEGKEVAQTQSYGPESRGGACRAELIISDNKIDYMKVSKPDYFLVFNEVSFTKYKDDLYDGSYILIDKTYLKDLIDDYKQVFKISATELAEKKLKGFVANLIMLGALAKTSDIVSYDSLKKAIKDVVSDEYTDINLEALELGYREVEK